MGPDPRSLSRPTLCRCGAAADADDANHEAALDVLARPRLRLVIPALIIAEVCYLIDSNLGAEAEAQLLASLSHFDVQAPVPEEWPRIAELVRILADFPLGGADASVIVLAERLRTDRVITFDRRHFRTVQPRHCKRFRLLPDDE
jgi:predicted nucleic acid-binding protein